MSSSNGDILDPRKKAEVEFHNKKRSVDPVEVDYDPICSTRKYYSINRRSSRLVHDWLSHRCRDKRVLVYGCGDGWQCLPPARSGAHVTGIDISDVSIEIARKNARAAGLSQISFQIMDCEALTFADSSFDIVVAAAILHHLNLPR